MSWYTHKGAFAFIAYLQKDIHAMAYPQGYISIMTYSQGDICIHCIPTRVHSHHSMHHKDIRIMAFAYDICISNSLEWRKKRKKNSKNVRTFHSCTIIHHMIYCIRYLFAHFKQGCRMKKGFAPDKSFRKTFGRKKIIKSRISKKPQIPTSLALEGKSR